MPEFLLHTIWLHGLFRDFPQFTTDGRPIEVVDPGLHNLDAGPDFFAATIRIGDELWAGNVEIHIKSSDWYRHGHQNDAAYDSVILHVVKQADKEVYNSQGKALVQCELRYPDDPAFFEGLLAERNWLCAQKWEESNAAQLHDWQRALLSDRIQKKTQAIRQLLMLNRNHWDQAFYITLAHNFGFHTNSLPMELTAKQTPLAYLLKHRNSLFQLEAMLFGQSGLLTEATATDAYSKRLWQEYKFLQTKFGLTPIAGSMWKMGRMRPQNFPHVRIAQFAALLHQEEHLLPLTIQTSDLKDLRKIFAVQPSEYWQTHYRFGAEVPAREGDSARGALGKSAIDILLINTAVPYKYAWGCAHGEQSLQQEAFALLDRIPAEHNQIVAQWKTLGVKVRSAADSQAFIHLYQEYCLRQRCLTCDVGYQIFTPSIEEAAKEATKQTTNSSLSSDADAPSPASGTQLALTLE